MSRSWGFWQAMTARVSTERWGTATPIMATRGRCCLLLVLVLRLLGEEALKRLCSWNECHSQACTLRERERRMWVVLIWPLFQKTYKALEFYYTNASIPCVIPFLKQDWDFVHISVFGTPGEEEDDLTRFSRGDCVINYGWERKEECPGWAENTSSLSTTVQKLNVAFKVYIY